MKEHENPYWSVTHDTKNGPASSGGDVGKGTYKTAGHAKHQAERHAKRPLDWNQDEKGNHRASFKSPEKSSEYTVSGGVHPDWYNISRGKPVKK